MGWLRLDFSLTRWKADVAMVTETAVSRVRMPKIYLSLERQHSEESGSRFIEVSRFEDDSPLCVFKVTEDRISRDVDMTDCGLDYVLRKWLHCDDAGELHAVTIGSQERFSTDVEQPFRYAASAMLANGKVVGQVTYTDH